MENGKNGTGFSTVRLELKTKLALMASVIYGLQEATSPDAAVKTAIEIQDLTDQYVDSLKKPVAA